MRRYELYTGGMQCCAALLELGRLCGLVQMATDARHCRPGLRTAHCSPPATATLALSPACPCPCPAVAVWTSQLLGVSWVVVERLAESYERRSQNGELTVGQVFRRCFCGTHTEASSSEHSDKPRGPHEAAGEQLEEEDSDHNTANPGILLARFILSPTMSYLAEHVMVRRHGRPHK